MFGAISRGHGFVCECGDRSLTDPKKKPHLVGGCGHTSRIREIRGRAYLASPLTGAMGAA